MLLLLPVGYYFMESRGGLARSVCWVGDVVVSVVSEVVMCVKGVGDALIIAYGFRRFGMMGRGCSPKNVSLLQYKYVYYLLSPLLSPNYAPLNKSQLLHTCARAW